jgi:hypothetical protein
VPRIPAAILDGTIVAGMVVLLHRCRTARLASVPYSPATGLPIEVADGDRMLALSEGRRARACRRRQAGDVRPRLFQRVRGLHHLSQEQEIGSDALIAGTDTRRNYPSLWGSLLRQAGEASVDVGGSIPSPRPISSKRVIRAYQTSGHPPVAVVHAFVIIRPTTRVDTTAHAICGLILTLRCIFHCFCR